MYASKSHVGCCHERRYGSVFTKALSSSPSLLLWGSNSRAGAHHTGNFCLIIPGTDTRRSGPHDVGRIRNHLFPSGQKKKKRGLNRGQFPDQQFCGCSYRKEPWKHTSSHSPQPSLLTPNDAIWLSCYANPRDSDTKTWCILWIYMNISYIIFIWVCFLSYVKTESFIPSFRVFVIISSLGRKRTIFFAHVTIMVLLAICFMVVCRMAFFFFFLISILSNLHQVTFMVYIDSMHWLLFPFISYRHLI